MTTAVDQLVRAVLYEGYALYPYRPSALENQRRFAFGAVYPRAWAERAYNIRRWTEMPAGGHFAAMEEPAALAADIRAFFKELR